MKKPKPTLIFLNASVVLAGMRSPQGGSALVLKWIKKRKIRGLISEIILEEIKRNAPKIKLDIRQTEKTLEKIFPCPKPAPSIISVANQSSNVIDVGDAHVLASCQELKPDFLVTLDKKHLLILKEKIKWIKIVTPGELIEILKK